MVGPNETEYYKHYAQYVQSVLIDNPKSSLSEQSNVHSAPICASDIIMLESFLEQLGLSKTNSLSSRLDESSSVSNSFPAGVCTSSTHAKFTASPGFGGGDSEATPSASPASVISAGSPTGIQKTPENASTPSVSPPSSLKDFATNGDALPQVLSQVIASPTSPFLGVHSTPQTLTPANVKRVIALSEDDESECVQGGSGSDTDLTDIELTQGDGDGDDGGRSPVNGWGHRGISTKWSKAACNGQRYYNQLDNCCDIDVEELGIDFTESELQNLVSKFSERYVRRKEDDKEWQADRASFLRYVWRACGGTQRKAHITAGRARQRFSQWLLSRKREK